MVSTLSLACAPLLAAISVHGAAELDATRGLCRYPDISKTDIVFVYGNDLWIVPKQGGVASPVASPPGFEGSPKFSPDGRTIAFRANYDDSLDLYTLPIAGGIPNRVTHHPTAETLCDWTPDGTGLVFMTSALEGLARAQKLYTVPVEGGLPTKLPVPYGANGSIDQTGEWLAYTPHSTDTRTWKRYRGGMATDVWLFNLKSGESRRITDWEGTDTLPMWHGRKVYYLSDNCPDQDFVLNVFCFDLDSGKTTQVSRFTTHDVKWPSIGPDDGSAGEIVLQHGDRIHRLNLATGAAVPVDITVPGDRDTLRIATVDAARDIQGASISPSGKRVAVVARGDIWSAPAENGTPRNLTRTDGVHERSATWSPDGKSIAFFSDATGEYELYTMPADGKGEAKRITTDGGAFRTSIDWSPDSKRVLIQDKSGHLDLVTIEDGKSLRLDRNPEAPRPVSVSFSHDSRWLAWSRSCDDTHLEAIYLADLDAEDPIASVTQVTSGFFSDSQPTFDRKGDWLVFQSDRNFRPSYSSFDTTWIYDNSGVMLAVPLRKDMKLPWLPTSDEEGQKDDGRPSPPPSAAPGGAPAGAGGPPGGGRRRRGGDGAVTAIALLAENAAGTWSCSATREGVAEPLPFTLMLTVEGNKVDGRVDSPGIAGAVSGEFDAESGDLTLSGSMSGADYRMSVTVRGDQLRGTFSSTSDDGENISGDVTGTRTAGAPEGAKQDDGKSDEAQSDDAKSDDGKSDDSKPEEPKKPAKKTITIDLEGFEARAVALPVPAGSIGSIGFNDRNELLYGRDGSVRIMDLSSRKPSEGTGVAGTRFSVSADGKKLLLGSRGGASIASSGAGASARPIVASPMLVEVHPRHERAQILVDAWRIFRDYFYDEGMHGVDWNAIRTKYEAMLPSVVTREDLNYLIAEMISELNVGHAYLQGAGDVESTANRSVGLLGVDFEAVRNEDGTPANAWKLARFVGGGAWDSDARSPLADQGLGVAEGDYLLAVNGEPVDGSSDPWKPFAGLAGKSTVLTVSKKPTIDSDAKDIVVTPIASETDLRYRDWVESKRRRVEELSGGKVGYIYVPNTGVDGQTELVRQFFGQRMKPALLIDDRWNGGGQIPTRFIELLNRPVTNYWARRDARDYAWPPDGHRGPMAMLINGLAGSGGDMFPWLFKHNRLGEVIGTRTWGGLVGISGNPGLMDGGSISVPTFGFYESDGTWGVEGHGIDPTIEVLDDPALMKGEGDPQLEEAVRVLLESIEKNGYRATPKPKGPDRRGMGLPEADK